MHTDQRTLEPDQANPTPAGDEFRWLEEVHDESALDWVRAQNRWTDELLASAELDGLQSRILQALDSPDRIAAVTVRGFDVPSRRFVSEQEGGFELPVAKTHLSWLDRDRILVGTVTDPDPQTGDTTRSSYARTQRVLARGKRIDRADEVFAVDREHVAAFGHHDSTPGWDHTVAVDARDFWYTVAASPSRFDTTGLQVRQHFAPSDDGTRVPYYQIGPADAPADGRNPLLMDGYGGFQASRLPGYSSVYGIGWLTRRTGPSGPSDSSDTSGSTRSSGDAGDAGEAGEAQEADAAGGRSGTYVVANIRGGGEYGPGWHRAALRENRHRAYEDLAAVARDLQRRGVTSRPGTAGSRSTATRTCPRIGRSSGRSRRTICWWTAP